MEQITVRIPEDTLEELQQEAEESAQSRSEHIRDFLNSRHDHDEHDCVPQEEFAALERDHDNVEQELERVRDEKRKILAQREENQQLRRYIEVEREHAEKTRQANLPTRLKWLVFGDQE